MATNTQNGSARTWFITGASSGIGHELTAAALARGDFVAAVARTVTSLTDLAGAYPDTLAVFAADVRDEPALRDAVSRTVTAFGGIDVVANNAGYGLFGAVEEASDTEARAVFDTNVFGVLNVLRAVLPVLRAQRSGHILQGSSLYGQFALPGLGMLAATKYAVEGLSDALAAEVEPLGIKVTLVQPSPTATSFGANLAFAGHEDDYDRTVRAVQKALGEAGPEAYASAARTAQAILAAVDSDRPPLRLALGRQAESGMRAALNARIKDLDDWSAVTHGVDG
ncbi:SDR family NAD(P)-dependent oxidoreductase [Streptomyces fuscigenes]|uniref:SDR family NAD(P)-dependent oxidoreductase n=1 Tax=Streptomyces fuscigenes TaxID=1528880 RepID=UPI001F469DD7|nr:SDR family NAD(P)-dependent oxidoreductase [Streptomyces fuscigenes]MCF3963231.1 SDR family NAD(P)-dependent oxidoreductase [Streptomyces fuscigenes]